jgi:hypothetical protein
MGRNKSFLLFVLIFITLILSSRNNAQEKKVYDFLLSLNTEHIRINFLNNMYNDRFAKVKQYGIENKNHYHQEIANGLKEKFRASDRFYLIVNEQLDDFFPIFVDVNFSMKLRQANSPTLYCKMTLYIINQHNELASWEGEDWLLNNQSHQAVVEINRVIEELFKTEFDLEKLANDMTKEVNYKKFIRLSPPGDPGKTIRYPVSDIVNVLKGIEKEIIVIKEAGKYYARTEKAFNLFMKGYKLMNYSNCLILKLKKGKKWSPGNKKVLVKCGSNSTPEEFSLAEHNRCDEADNITGIDCSYDGVYVEVTDKLYREVIRQIGLKTIKDSKKKICVIDEM